MFSSETQKTFLRETLFEVMDDYGFLAELVEDCNLVTTSDADIGLQNLDCDSVNTNVVE